MSGLGWRRTAMVGAAAIAGSLSSVSGAEAAGLFDFLFGSPPPVYRPVPQYYDSEPLRMRVSPERQQRRSEKRQRPVKTVRESKPALSKPIDPKANPNWYLEDPTLRRGDIVVLKGQVLVFDGGRVPVTPGDFTALSKSRAVSKGERERILKMTGPQDPAASLADKTAALATE